MEKNKVINRFKFFLEKVEDLFSAKDGYTGYRIDEINEAAAFLTKCHLADGRDKEELINDFRKSYDTFLKEGYRIPPMGIAYLSIAERCS